MTEQNEDEMTRDSDSNKRSRRYGHLNTFIMCVSTIVTCFLSYLVWKTEDKSYSASRPRINMEMNLQRYNYTSELMSKINNDYQLFTDLSEDDNLNFKIWELGDDFDKFYPIELKEDSIKGRRIRIEQEKWNNLTRSDRIKILKENQPLQKLLYHFESAMLLYQRDLLDVEYFYEYVFNFFNRLEKANPSIYEYIDHLRNELDSKDVWEGLTFCRDSVLIKAITVEAPIAASPLWIDAILVKENDYVREGDHVMRLVHINSDSTATYYNAKSKSEGYVNKILYKNNEKVIHGASIIELRHRKSRHSHF